ncbi:tetratricopeptide repeat domain-containing protein [Fusarium bulbicola]|nr:tetratricopeptide repeat domain-containing protein [Fusarium bulbicola]
MQAKTAKTKTTTRVYDVTFAKCLFLPASSAERYAQKVVNYSKLGAGDAYLCGLHYSRLGKFLISPYLSYGEDWSFPPQDEGFQSVALCDLTVSHEGPSRTTLFRQPDDFLQHLKQSLTMAETEDQSLSITSETPSSTSTRTSSDTRKYPGRVVFLRGFPSAQWLSCLGSTLDVDPEFFYRHLEATMSNGPRSDQSFSTPFPWSQDLLELRVCNTGSWDTNGFGPKLVELRRDCESKIRKHIEDFAHLRNFAVGDSVVRRFLVHNRHHFSIEQRLSIEVIHHTRTWSVIVWQDSGKDISRGASGHLFNLQNATTLHPIFQHRPRMATTGTTDRAGSSAQEAEPFPQSINHLQANYGRHLKSDIMVNDVFYALSELFEFSAASVDQLLKHFEDSIAELLRLDNPDTTKISELLILKSYIDDYRSYVGNILKIVKTRGNPKWPRVTKADPKKRERADLAAERLELRYEHLLGKCERLSEHCAGGISILMSLDAHEQTAKAMTQAGRLGKLSVLVYVYIPITFAASFYGMNFAELGDHLSIWCFFAMAAPLLVVSMVAWFVDVRTTYPDGKGWDITKLLMKGNRRDISKDNMTEQEIEGFATSCRSFEDLQLDIPILSVHETRETKSWDSRLSNLRKRANAPKMLLTREMVMTRARRESLFEVEKAHMDLCDIEELEPLYDQLTSFFSTFVHHAPKNLQYALHQPSFRAAASIKLKTSSSIASSDYPDNKIYTPKTDSDDIPTHTCSNDSGQHGEVEGDSEPVSRQSLELPFLHTGSITRIGKTETASEYLYSRLQKFNVVIWVYSDTERKLGPQFVTLAKELGGDAISDTIDEVSAREFVNGWLADPVGHRVERGRSIKVDDIKWLMVFDNADDPELLYDWLPSQGPGSILVTGKYPYVKENAYRLDRGIDLEPFSSREGGDMLQRLSGRQDEAGATEASMRVSDELGGHPLAISQMSAIIREHHLTFQDFEDWYQEDAKELYDLRAGGRWTNYKHTVATAWSLEHASEKALALLNVLSLLDPDRIPEEILIDGAKDVKLSNYPAKKHIYFKARTELIHASLIKRNMATNELQIHRLVQQVVRQRMDQKRLHDVYSAIAVLLSEVWPFVSGTDPTRNQAWRIPVAERYAPQICKLEEHFAFDINSNRFQGTAISGYIFSSYAWYMSERGVPEQTQMFACLAKTILEQFLDDLSSDQERVTHWLGEAHHSLSLTACITGSSDGLEDAEAWQRLLNSRIEKYGLSSDKLALATAYNQLGICQSNKEQFADAVANFDKSVTAYNSVADAPQFSATFPAISQSMLHCLMHRYNEAEHALRPFLEEHERVLGKDDKTTSRSGLIWRTMGDIRNGQQLYEEAIDYHMRALDNLKTTCGEKHYFTGDCFYSLGKDVLRHGKKEEAIAIDVFTSAPHREAQAARALWQKGRVVKEFGDELQSKQVFGKAMELRRKLAPDDGRTIDDLEENDWTKLIIYWSR